MNLEPNSLNLRSYINYCSLTALHLTIEELVNTTDTGDSMKRAIRYVERRRERWLQNNASLDQIIAKDIFAEGWERPSNTPGVEDVFVSRGNEMRIVAARAAKWSNTR